MVRYVCFKFCGLSDLSKAVFYSEEDYKSREVAVCYEAGFMEDCWSAECCRFVIGGEEDLELFLLSLKDYRGKLFYGGRLGFVGDDGRADVVKVKTVKDLVEALPKVVTFLGLDNTELGIGRTDITGGGEGAEARA